jgi:hypothetical protein
MAIGTPGLSSGSAAYGEVFESVPFMGKRFFDIRGVAIVPSGSTAASIAIVRPAQEKGASNGTMTIPANAEITKVAFSVEGAVTIAAATGKLKLAASLAAATADLYVESAAASGGVLAAATVSNHNPLDSTTSVGGTAVTYRIYATDGGAAGAAAASTVTATTDTTVYVQICGYLEDGFPAIETFPPILDTFVDG